MSYLYASDHYSTRGRLARADKRAERLAPQLRELATRLGLIATGTSVFNPKTQKSRTYKSVDKMLRDAAKGEFGEKVYGAAIEILIERKEAQSRG